MPRVPREKIEHFLNVLPTAKPIKQKLCRFTPDKKEAIRVEIKWLLAAEFIKEVYHPEWLANPILVRKKNKEWRMCVDYTDLNKHCPKDPFGLPLIGEVVDSTVKRRDGGLEGGWIVFSKTLSRRLTDTNAELKLLV